MSLYKKYGITKKEVVAWAKKKYPQFLRNVNVLAQLYLRQVKKVKLDPRTITVMRGKKSTIKDLKVGEWCIIEGVVGIKTRETTYSGCPICMRKVEGEYCTTCGKIDPVIHYWRDYVVGDNTGDIIATIPPRIADERVDYEGKILRMRGVLTEQGDFLVNMLQEVVERIPPKLIEKKVEVVEKKEVEVLDRILTMFDTGISLDDLKTWHADRKLKTKLELLIKEVGGKVGPDGKVRKAVKKK